LTATRLVPEWISSFQVAASPSNPPKRDNVVETSKSEPDVAVNHTSSQRRATVTTTPRSVLLLALGYALFISLRAFRLARFWRRKEKLRRSASRTGVTPGIEAAARRCRDLLNVTEAPVTLSARAHVPYTIGTLRPLIVLPE